eukprot:9547886-Alexandrium_andersonii.AAC.1
MASTCPRCKASSAGLGAILRIDSDGDDETGRQARQERFFGGNCDAERVVWPVGRAGTATFRGGFWGPDQV